MFKSWKEALTDESKKRKKGGIMMNFLKIAKMQRVNLHHCSLFPHLP